MGLLSKFVYKDKDKQKWWLHSKQKGKTTIYYFTKEEEDAIEDLPDNYQVFVNPRSGMPMLKKIFKAPEGFKESKTSEGEEPQG
jgi:hypothetical protein